MCIQCILLYLCIVTVECCAVHFQVPYSSLHPACNSTINSVVHHWHSHLDHLQLTKSYGLFWRMTGVGGHPEVILEGSIQLTGLWLKYNFLYWPGGVNSCVICWFVLCTRMYTNIWMYVLMKMYIPIDMSSSVIYSILHTSSFTRMHYFSYLL
jgi:hypothetical protein